MSLWLTIAEREQFVVAFPDGAIGSDDAQGWNDCRADARANPETDDVEFLADVIDDAAAIVASMAADSECDSPNEAVSVLIMNGTADLLVDYEGGQVPFRRGGVMATSAAAEPSIAEQYGPIWTNVVGPQNHDIEAAEEIWSFFASISGV